MTQATETKQSQRIRILAELRKARSRGVTNGMLVGIALRYGSRLHELRRKGWKIETVRMSNGWFKYILRPASWA